LAVFPSNPDTTGISGFPLGTLLDACSILAHNHRGRLVLTTTDERVGDDDSDPDLLVPPGNYIFIVVNAGTEYAALALSLLTPCLMFSKRYAIQSLPLL
jgi:hypothetical protein